MSSKKLICFLLLFVNVFSLLCGGTAYAEAPDKSVRAFEKMTDEYMKKVLEEYKVAGAAVSVVKDGRIFFKKGYGYADINEKIAVSPDTTAFHICSVSKVFTATAAMQMVEQGKLSLDTDVNDYLTAFKVKNPFSKPVTLRTLLTHTSGFEDETPLYLKSNGDVFFDSLPKLEDELKAYLPSVVYEPGTVCQYSIYGMALAGYLVEKASGKPFSDYVTDNILKPLDMKNSSYGLNKDIIRNMAKPYKYNGVFNEDAYRLMSDHPSGSIIASASDMAAFMLMHLNNGEYNGKKLLNKDTAIEMHKHQYPNDGKLTGFGLGFYETMRNGRRTIEHGGYIPTFSSKMTMLPNENIGMFIAINTDSKQSGRVCNKYVDKFYDFFTSEAENTEAEAALKADIPLDIALDKINGSYIFDTYSRSDVTKLKAVLLTCKVQCDEEGKLTFSADGNSWEFGYAGNGYFYNKEIGYCRISDKGSETYLSILGLDYEKVNASYQKILIASIVFLPIILISILILIISIIRKRKIKDKKLLILKSALLLMCILLPLFYGLIGLVGFKSMSSDTLVVRNVLLPLIPAVCYLTLIATTIAAVLTGKSWLSKEYSIGSKLYYSLLIIGALINLVFMFIMNGFKM